MYEYEEEETSAELVRTSQTSPVYQELIQS